MLPSISCYVSLSSVLCCSFQHQMSLRRNATEFAERVRGAPISGNIDNPEGGLDALMQVKLNLRSKNEIYERPLLGYCL